MKKHPILSINMGYLLQGVAMVYFVKYQAEYKEKT